MRVTWVMRNLIIFVLTALFGSSFALAEGSFPEGFKWCVATSAHQIEGGNIASDWWDWEQQQGKIKNGDKSGKACDHWHRVKEDIGLMGKLGVNQYRFSIEWAKIEPTPGAWNLLAAGHYRREIALLRERGIEPMITLHHFTLPRWFAAMGGWESPQAAELFARYVAFVYKYVATDVRDFITINEPMVHLVLGYAAGINPPGKKGELKSVVPPMVGLLKAHALAYQALHSLHKKSRFSEKPLRVGVAHHLRVFDPASSWNPADRLLASRLDHAFNWAFAETLETGHLKLNIPFVVDVNVEVPEAKGTQDFIGVNYYTRDMVEVVLGAPGFKLSVPAKAETNDLGWEIYPEGFYRVLKATAKRFPGKQIFVTENGLADARDVKREAFIESHLSAMRKAMKEGVPVAGYCHWSLYDNFEWSEGFAPRFGLFEIDYNTLERKPRPSALKFSEIARKNSL